MDQVRGLRGPVKQLADQVETEVADNAIHEDHGIKPRGRVAEPELLQPPLGQAQTQAAPL